MRLFFVSFVVAALAVACTSTPPKKAAPDEDSEGGFYVEPQAKSDERAARLLPTTGSEDARHLLRYEPSLPPPAPADSAASYYPNERFDWILPVQLAHSVTNSQVRRCFGGAWNTQHGQPTLYGRATTTGRWGYVFAGDADTVFSALALRWKLYEARTEAPRPFTLAELQGFEAGTRAQAAQLPGRLDRPNYAAPQAAERSRALGSFVTTNDRPVIIVLQADSAFRGRAIWDVMLSLGLHWGDADLFHWDNPVPAVSGDYLFDVSTSTEPGYFLPERIAAGEVATADLVFSFSIPRTAAPAQVLASMHRAASYCQHRLGGRLLNAAGQPFDLAAASQQCQAVESNLRRQGLRPGVGDALYLF